MSFKKILLLSVLTSLSLSVAHADTNNRFSVGYASTNLKFTDGESSNLKGFNIKYQHEFFNDIGLIASLVATRNEDTQKGFYRDAGVVYGKWVPDKLIHGITRKDTQKYYSLSIGPTWRFNDWVSAYAVAGVAKTEFRTSVHNLTEKYKTDERKTAATYGAGVQISLINNWLMDVSYDYMKTGDIKASTWMVGVGYRF
ncbi:Ail/Lom family outer membrane beta-barrel protein [Escherichia coli]|uniref:Ail/Lom family outer membrane beta-barrel protein n=1 Tax=Escherichia coli TaxID=562 RepID=UPI0030F44BD3